MSRSLLSITELGETGLRRMLDTSDHMAEVNRRPNPKVPALRGKTVCNVFFEDSTRTRLSFETAAKRLSADTMNFSVSQSSLNKGESLRDTVETIAAMGVDAFVIRHGSSGAPWQIGEWTSISVINAGDGWHAHPTQALLDMYTVRTALNRPISVDGGSFDGLRVAMVGDIKHSRVARSATEAFKLLGADVTWVSPKTLLPPVHDESVVANLDEVIEDVDVLYLLRMQNERMSEALVPHLREYTARFGLTPERAARIGRHVLVMHPGPMNRGVEMAVDPGELPGSVINQQVTNGINVRMAVSIRAAREWLGELTHREYGIMNILITNARLIDQTGERLASVRISDGIIIEIGDQLAPDSDNSGAEHLIDAAGLVISPGFVDLHVHLREPGREEAETIETGSRGAALGGFTAVVAMPNTDPYAGLGRSCGVRPPAREARWPL